MYVSHVATFTTLRLVIQMEESHQEQHLRILPMIGYAPCVDLVKMSL